MGEKMETSAFDAIIARDQPLMHLNKIAKKPPVDIEFQDLSYSVTDSTCSGGWRQLLKSVNGKFRSGELTAILGPSGAGKSTLLNILAGYVTAGLKGIININGKPRNLKLFNKLSSYIMQDDVVQPRLTVMESMMVAADLKLGSKTGPKGKKAVVEEVINLLGLQSCVNTMSDHLSGGQRRRLTVALELVNNPPVIFLDEPMTGLDNVAAKQCMELLQKITRLGRTVICTIHQPPASLFQNFDQVYVLARGYCVFNGSPSQLVPFMASANCECPATSTPADFIIELVQSDPDVIQILQNHIQNGKCNLQDVKEVMKSSEPISYEPLEIYQDTTETIDSHHDLVFNSTFSEQFLLLSARMLLQIKRNKPMLYIQFFHHVVSGLLLGGIFFGMGNDASQTISMFKYCISINVFFMYTYTMVPVLLFPQEVQLLKREYFNRWYSLKAYYLATTVSSVPLMVLNGVLFMAIVYLLTDQPLEWERYIWFNLIGLTMGFCSQGLGYAIGASFNILDGSVVAPHILAVVLALGVYGMGYKDGIESFMKVLMSFSYFRFGLVGLVWTLFYDRNSLQCDEIYCHYKNPKLLMDDMGVTDVTMHNQILFILLYMILFRTIAYISLKYTMTSELRNKIVYYVVKVVKHSEP